MSDPASVHIYLRGELLLMVGLTPPYDDPTSVVLQMPATASDAAVGHAALAVIDSSAGATREPTETSLFRLAAVKSPSELARGAHLVLTYREKDRIFSQAMKNVGRGSFEGLKDHYSVKDVDAAMVGSSIREALAASERADTGR